MLQRTRKRLERRRWALLLAEAGPPVPFSMPPDAEAFSLDLDPRAGRSIG